MIDGLRGKGHGIWSTEYTLTHDVVIQADIFGGVL